MLRISPRNVGTVPRTDRELRKLLLGLAMLVVLAGSACASSPSDARPSQVMRTVTSAEFQRNWFDGKAELAGYDLTTTRYGATRKGVAVTVFVTEPFSFSTRVKADSGRHPPVDEFSVMKLNLIEDFPTGVYDYNLMTSAFVALAPSNGLPAGAAVKVSFSSQEWCGHVYEQLRFDPDGSIRRDRHSYFDGEADVTDTVAPARQREDAQRGGSASGVSEDVLLLWARGMAEPVLAAGETREMPMLRSVKTARLNHLPLEWIAALFARSPAGTKVVVPAGEFECDTYTVEVSARRMWTIDVERAFPHRIIRWQNGAGEKAELLGVERLTYWQMNGPGMEEAVRKFGLSPRPARTP